MTAPSGHRGVRGPWAGGVYVSTHVGSCEVVPPKAVSLDDLWPSNSILNPSNKKIDENVHGTKDPSTIE